MQAMSDVLDVREDWSDFLNEGVKVIWVTAGSDSVSNPRAQMRLYERVVAHNGQAAIDKAVRYYVLPNAVHGLMGNSASGQPIPNTWDMQAAIQNWVENGIVPPDAPVLSTQSSGTRTTRPICRYPNYPKYNGSGDPGVASNFTCAKP